MRALFALSSLLLVTGCGSSHEPGEGDDAGLTREAFFERFYELRCDEAAWCADRVLPVGCPHPDGRTWQRVVERAGDNVLFDAEAAAECLASLPARGECGSAYSAYPACGRVFLPNRAVGESCTQPATRPSYWLECEEGSICVATDRCPPTCRPIGAGGAPCTIGLECESRWCDEGRCVPTAALGEPCGPGVEASCERGLLCEEGRCARTPDRGDECEVDGLPCPITDLCLASADGVRRCAEASSVPLGGECRRGPWVPDTCPGHLVCDAGADGWGVCVEGTAVGASCATLPCAPGGRCVDERCVAVAFSGEACGPPPDGPVCPPNLACAGGTCRMRPTIGERCDDALPCLRGACVGGTCALLPEGADCSEAAPLSCVGGCIEGRCASPLPVGEPCSVPNQCGPELWCRPASEGNVCAERCAP